MKNLYDEWQMSPAIICNGFAFLTGFNGASLQGIVSHDPETQMLEAFQQVEMVLKAGSMGFEHVVEMTSYHVGLRDHLALLRSVRSRFVVEPYPAWTAIDVAGFATERVIIELRAIAKLP
ncbi:MAG: Rid family hydrolase [Hyphomicrobiales bacterium]